MRDTDSAIGRLNLRPKSLTLEDLARVHGHLCDGLDVAWVSLGVGLRSLFPDGVVDWTDVRAVSKNGPCWSDAAAWTTGARVNHGTLVLDVAVGDSFILQRASVNRAVRVGLRAGVFPEELARLEDPSATADHSDSLSGLKRSACSPCAGASPLTGLRGLMVGSVTQRVVHHGTTSVFVAR